MSNEDKHGEEEVSINFEDHSADSVDRRKKNELLYKIDDRPPWYLCLILGFQHYLTMFGSTVAVPMILASSLGVADNPVALGKLISTIFFVSGIVTLLQTIVGNRLPIIQGGTFAFLSPAIAILTEFDATHPVVVDATVPALANGTVATTTAGSVEDDERWMSKMVLLQGSIMVASLAQILIGATGLPGLLMTFIGPVTIAPTVAMVGMGLWKAAADTASANWGIAVLTMVLIILFSQYLSNISIPLPRSDQKLPLFKLFPVFLAIVSAWSIYAILAAAGVVDVKSSEVLDKSPWFRVPYPGQWGAPKVTLPAVLGMLGAVLASMIESIGDYYACARLCQIRPPPKHAINRGILIEGLGCLIAGLFGTGNGTTSYSENVGAIGITRVGSRLVVQFGAGIMIVLASIGKFGAVFTTLPQPIVGGMFFVMFGMITAVGLSSLKHVDLDSTRNLLIIGFSIFVGLAVPSWINLQGPGYVSTGNAELDQVASIFLKTSMFLSMVTAFFLDNTIPGTKEERGLVQANLPMMQEGNNKAVVSDPYMFPDLLRNGFAKLECLSRIPVCPSSFSALPTSSDLHMHTIKNSAAATN